MFGFGDVWVFLGYLLTIGSMLLCVVYGIRNWNSNRENMQKKFVKKLNGKKTIPRLMKAD